MASSKGIITQVNITCAPRSRFDWLLANLGETLGVSRDPSERFWRKVQIGEAEECWPWKAGKQSGGYGSFRLGRTQYAHRVAWMLTHGRPVPAGLDILHSCDHPPCCNPAHLSPGTAKDNLGQASARGRLAVGRPNRRQVPAETIAAIRAYLATNTHRGAITEAAQLYDVKQSYVSMVMRGKRRQYDTTPIGERPTRTHKYTPKLTDEQRQRIAYEVAIGPRGTSARLALEHGVTKACISKIANAPLRPSLEQVG